MNGCIKLYKVIDAESKEVLGEGLRASQVSELIGTENTSIYISAKRKNLVMKKYYIDFDGEVVFSPSKKDREKEKKQRLKGFAKEWDAECERIKELPKSILQMRIASV